MDNTKIINRLDSLEAYFTCGLEEVKKLKKELQPKTVDKDADFEIKRAKVMARYRKNMTH